MQKKKKDTGVIEVDLFPKQVDTPDHPEAVTFKLLLEQVADQFDCELLFFEVKNGTVSFAFDNEDLMAEILKILQGRIKELESSKDEV